MPEARFVSPRSLLVIFIAFTACASRPSTSPGITDPEIAIAQEIGPAQLGWPVGSIELKYAFQISNEWSQPMTVTRIEVRSVNPAGAAYSLRPDSYFLRESIPAGESRIITIWPKAYSFGRGARESEPISLRAVVHFETPAGAYQKVINRELPQD